MKRSVSIMAILVAVLPGAAGAASFDCGKAFTLVEKTVCSDRELSTLDDSMKQAYDRALAVVRDPGQLRREQRQWLKSERDACRDVRCLKSRYEKRLGQLNSLLATGQASPVAGTSAASGTAVREKKLTRETQTLSIDLSWPEIHSDEYPQAAAALAKRIQADIDKAHREFLKETAEVKPPDIGGETIKNGLSAAYRLTYNVRGIVSLFTDIYTFTGGAHGSTVRTGYTFDLKNGRDRSLGDFMGPDWQSVAKSAIVPQINARSEDFFEESRQGRFEINPGQFYLTPKGVVVFFQQYEIAPYSSGIPEFTIAIEQP